MSKFFKRDQFGLGVIMGILLPVILLFLFYFVNALFGRPPLSFHAFIRNETFQLVCIAVNVLPFRQYMIKYKFDKTGRGMLISTFAYAILYVVVNYLLK
jgi:hypothetical protein